MLCSRWGIVLGKYAKGFVLESDLSLRGSAKKEQKKVKHVSLLSYPPKYSFKVKLFCQGSFNLAQKGNKRRNIARGTADPGYWRCILNNLCICNLLGGVTCITSNIGHHGGYLNWLPMALLTLLVDLANSWRFLNELHTWPPSGTTCISFNFGHQVAPLALTHCLGSPYWQ